jgi:glutamate dehydrogenase (NAD(P)+)
MSSPIISPFPSPTATGSSIEARHRRLLPDPHGQWARGGFTGYRVQHHLTLGPAKGGTRFAANVDIGEIRCARDLDELEMRARRPALRRRQGRRRGRSRALSLHELENLPRRYMQEMIPFVGPRVDVMAPDMGTNEQVMAWFMDTYSMYQGITVPEIVTGKPVGTGGTLGRREATGHGVAFLAFRAMEALDIDPTRATAIVQGFGNVGTHAAMGLAARGVKLVGVSITRSLSRPKGLDVPALVDHVREKGALSAGRAKRSSTGGFLGSPAMPSRPARSSERSMPTSPGGSAAG